MKARGKFIGQTSCGFVTGNVYTVKMKLDGPYISLKDVRGPGYCPYKSIATLAQNWDIPYSKDHVNEYPIGNLSMGD